VEQRGADVPGLTPPSWQEVVARDYRPWNSAHVVIDTARLTLPESVDAILNHLAAAGVKTSG
jgi:hypothetical protein